MQMVMGLVLSLLIIAFGAIFQLPLFLHNSFGILFFLFFLFQLAMASFAFLCSIPIRKVAQFYLLFDLCLSSLFLQATVLGTIMSSMHKCLPVSASLIKGSADTYHSIANYESVWFYVRLLSVWFSQYYHSTLQASTAVNLGFMVFIAGWIMQVVIIFGYPYTPQYYHEVVVGTVLFTLLPWLPSLSPAHLACTSCKAKSWSMLTNCLTDCLADLQSVC